MIENEIWMSRLNGIRALFGQAKALAVGRVFGRQGARGEQRFGGQVGWRNAEENGFHTKTRPPVILVAADSSTVSIEAANFGISVARRAQGKLLLVHAVHLNLDPCGPAQVSRLKAELSQEACDKFEPIMLRAQAAGVSAICAVEEGEPIRVIAQAAKRWEADLIVVAERACGRFARWFGRGFAERVLEQSGCPVFVLSHERKIGGLCSI